MNKHAKKLLVIFAESVLEKRLIALARQLGAHGYTVLDVRGGGAHGAREGAWDADKTIELKVVADEAVADAIAEQALSQFGAHHALRLYLADVDVVRADKF
jgi:nitrogen regulatory protein P-II 2